MVAGRDDDDGDDDDCGRDDDSVDDDDDDDDDKNDDDVDASDNNENDGGDDDDSDNDDNDYGSDSPAFSLTYYNLSFITSIILVSVNTTSNTYGLTPPLLIGRGFVTLISGMCYECS